MIIAIDVYGKDGKHKFENVCGVYAYSVTADYEHGYKRVALLVTSSVTGSVYKKYFKYDYDSRIEIKELEDTRNAK